MTHEDLQPAGSYYSRKRKKGKRNLPMIINNFEEYPMLLSFIEQSVGKLRIHDMLCQIVELYFSFNCN